MIILSRARETGSPVKTTPQTRWSQHFSPNTLIKETLANRTKYKTYTVDGPGTPQYYGQLMRRGLSCFGHAKQHWYISMQFYTPYLHDWQSSVEALPSSSRLKLLAISQVSQVKSHPVSIRGVSGPMVLHNSCALFWTETCIRVPFLYFIFSLFHRTSSHGTCTIVSNHVMFISRCHPYSFSHILCNRNPCINISGTSCC